VKGFGLDGGVEQHVEGLAELGADGVDLADVDALEERLVGDPAQRVVDAGVDGVAVTGEGEAVVQVSLGCLVLSPPAAASGNVWRRPWRLLFVVE
jgi:hypothetical protein